MAASNTNTVVLVSSLHMESCLSHTTLTIEKIWWPEAHRWDHTVPSFPQKDQGGWELPLVPSGDLLCPLGREQASLRVCQSATCGCSSTAHAKHGLRCLESHCQALTSDQAFSFRPTGELSAGFWWSLQYHCPVYLLTNRSLWQRWRSHEAMHNLATFAGLLLS